MCRSLQTDGAPEAPSVFKGRSILLHNRPMTPFRTWPAACLLMGVAWVGGCDNTGSVGAFGTPSRAAPASAMEFRGQRACADCSGIEASLTLEERGDQQRYRLIETYRSADRERRFEDEGEWRWSGGLLRLQSSRGGERVYLVLPDNRLQATGSRGNPLPAAADEVMVPVAYSKDS